MTSFLDYIEKYDWIFCVRKGREVLFYHSDIPPNITPFPSEEEAASGMSFIAFRFRQDERFFVLGKNIVIVKIVASPLAPLLSRRNRNEIICTVYNIDLYQEEIILDDKSKEDARAATEHAKLKELEERARRVQTELMLSISSVSPS